MDTNKKLQKMVSKYNIQKKYRNLNRITNWLIEYMEDRCDHIDNMKHLHGEKYLEAFNELAQIDFDIDNLRKEKRRLEKILCV